LWSKVIIIQKNNIKLIRSYKFCIWKKWFCWSI